MAAKISNRCRLCANINSELNLITTNLAKQIHLLYQLKIDENHENANDRFPTNICPTCTTKLKDSWTFYNKIKSAQKRLAIYVDVEAKPAKKSQSVSTEETDYCEIIHVKKTEVDSDIDDEVSETNEDNTFAETLDIGPSEDPLWEPMETKEEENDSDASCDSPGDESSEVSYSAKEEASSQLGDSSKTWPDYPWGCNICERKCTDSDDYKRHDCFKLHNMYFCVDCPKAYSRLPVFYAHVTEHHWERHQKHLQLQCDVCHSWFNCQAEQEVHRGLEHPEVGPRPPPEVTKPTKNDFECDECGKKYRSRGQLNFHVKSHSGVKPFACDECDKSFCYKITLASHKKQHLVKEFTCDQCGRSFHQKSNLDAHLLTHSNSRPFACDICPKAFKSSRQLRIHGDVHTCQGAQHVCDVCGRGFRVRSQLQVHARLHTGEKPYACQECGMKFRLRGGFTAHMRQHTGEKPFSCEDCERTFTNWPNMHAHMKRMHGRPATSTRNLTEDKPRINVDIDFIEEEIIIKVEEDA